MCRKFFVGLAALVLLLPSAGLCAVEGLDVSLSTEYLHRSADMDAGDDESDADSFNRLGVDLSRLGVEGLTFSGVVWYGADLDGTQANSPFVDLLDTYEGRDEARVYRALFTYDLAEGMTLKAGRQDVMSAERATIDGALFGLESGCGCFELELFAGSRVSFYSDPDEKGVYGANLDLRFGENSKIRVMDLYYLENSLELQFFHKLGRVGQLRAGYRHFGSEPLELDAQLDSQLWEGGELSIYYKRRLSDADDVYGYDYTAFKDENDAALNFGSFAESSDTGFEYRQGLMGGMLYGYLGARMHNILDDAEEDEYNTDYAEFTAGAQLDYKNFRAALEGNRWVEDRSRADLDEENAWGASVTVEYRTEGKSRFGASFAQDSYDADGMERESQTTAAWAKLALLKSLGLDLRYEHATDDLYESDGIDSVSEYSARLNFKY